METRPGEWALLEFHRPQHHAVAVAVILRDVLTDQIHVQIQPLWWTRFHSEDAEICRYIIDDFPLQAKSSGAAQALDLFETTMSHILRISDRQAISIDQIDVTLELLCHSFLQRPGLLSRAEERFRKYVLPLPWEQDRPWHLCDISKAGMVAASLFNLLFSTLQKQRPQLTPTALKDIAL